VLGTLIGGYRVVTELGGGPTGIVYYAEHPVIGRRAAIKVLASELGDDGRLERFLTHMRAVSAIRHPNIVDVLDIGQVPNPARAGARGGGGRGLTFVVMEMLEGESLGERLERVGGARTPGHGMRMLLDEVEVVRLLIQIASAVGAAHERGLTHASLKPENIFITNGADYPDFVKVLDFGATKLRPPGPPAPSPYLAPEVFAGGEATPGADVYAVGVLAYEMLTGTPPVARTPRSVDEIPAPHERREGLSRALSDAVMRAIADDPDERWGGLREFRRAVEGAQQALPPQTNAMATSLPAPAAAPTVAEAERIERVQARKVGKTLSTIILRRMNENRLQLPSMPLVALRCLDLLSDPDVTFAEVARVIEQDPVIAARVLRIVNSAAYARRHTVSTLEQAARQIGVKPMRILLVELAACQIFTSRSAGIRQKLKQTWEHCLAVGILARDLAVRLRSAIDPDVAYLAGLLHDVGKPIVGGLLLEAERALLDELDAPWMTETLWQKTVAEAHRGVGAAVAAAWNLPPAIAEAILQCHAYDRGAGRDACANLVRFANTLAKREGIYLGEVSSDEIIAAVLQGRVVLDVDEATETALLATLRERTHALTQTRAEARANDRPRAERVTDRGRRARPA
jgi:putative nucleotidyltransferase with HDIG domain